MKKHTRQLVTAVAACTLIGAMAIGGTMAYLTDSKEATNTFTVGEVKVDLTEPNWPGSDNEGHPDLNYPGFADLIPNQEVPKDPMVKNVGKNDAIVFMTLEVPMADVTVVAADGTKGEKTLQELFWFKQEGDVKGAARNNFNGTNWRQLPDMTVEGGTAEAPIMSYVFAYETKLKPEDTTDKLFDKIQLKNIIENEVSTETELDVNIKVYAIQADAIWASDSNLDLTAVGDAGRLDTSNLIKIYDIYVNQNSDSEPEVPSESEEQQP